VVYQSKDKLVRGNRIGEPLFLRLLVVLQIKNRPRVEASQTVILIYQK